MNHRDQKEATAEVIAESVANAEEVTVETAEEVSAAATAENVAADVIHLLMANLLPDYSSTLVRKIIFDTMKCVR
jgi:hypothetical protein